MSYYILAEQLNGELIQVSTEPLVQGQGQVLKIRDGNIPDLNKYEWYGGSLAFVEKNQNRILTKLSFMRRFSNEELGGIYTAAKSNVLLEVWLDKFKLAEAIGAYRATILKHLSGKLKTVHGYTFIRGGVSSQL